MSVAERYKAEIERLPFNFDEWEYDETAWGDKRQAMLEAASDCRVDTTNYGVPGKPETPRFFFFADGSTLKVENFWQANAPVKVMVI